MSEAPEHVVHSISTASIVKAILIVLGFFVLFFIRDIILVLLTAVVIASAIEPGTRWLVRRGSPRLLAVAVIYTLIIVGIITLSYLILPFFITNLAGFVETLPQHIMALNVKTKTGLGTDFSSWQSALSGLSKSQSLGQLVENVTTGLSTATGSILATITAVFGGLTSFVLMIVLSFYLSVRERGIEEFLRIVTPVRKEEYIINLWRRTQHKIGRWLQGQLLLAVIVGVLVFIGLTILGVKNAFLFALLSAVFEIIPIFGPVIGAVPGVITGFLQGGLTFGVVVALMYLIIQQIESNVIFPLVFRKILDIHPLIIIIALMIGYKLGGILGVLLSVPIAAAITEYVSDVSKNKNTTREKFGMTIE
jgi:predicted PurR-regulated permease PerM